ncbi:Protein of uncharacterised function (DUF2514) [Oligella urethralis]|uniref:DUF2514 family protein n=1 Tax=Oligella urethralis TaxID=90245 RepID=UPI000E04F814|nr:DUF2514 family protein [Oligella urethralis]SUA63189.1 Protein of uncharacterised function (DUF2514) [Oligella urethralis]
MNISRNFIKYIFPVLIFLVTGVFVYFFLNTLVSSSHKKGYQEGLKTAQLNYVEEINRLNAETREKEIKLQKEMENIRNEANKQKEEATIAINNANAAVSRLQQSIQSNRKASVSKQSICPASNAFRAKDNTPQCWLVLEEAIGRYREVAEDADALVEKLRIGQGWGTVIENNINSSIQGE